MVMKKTTFINVKVGKNLVISKILITKCSMITKKKYKQYKSYHRKNRNGLK